jgi:hypothetical protein
VINEITKPRIIYWKDIIDIAEFNINRWFGHNWNIACYKYENKIKLKRQKRWFQFSHCEHSSSTCIWSIYLSVDTIFQSLWFLSEFPWKRVAANKDATEPLAIVLCVLYSNSTTPRDVWSRPTCICGFLYFKLNGIDVINEITKPRIIYWKDIIDIAEFNINRWSIPLSLK